MPTDKTLDKAPHASRWTGALALSLSLLLALVAWVYWPGVNGGFTFDDYPNIVFNKNLQVRDLQLGHWLTAVFSSNAGELQRPIAMLTFAMNFYFTGMDPMPMKITNIAIHLLNTILVFGLLRSLLRAAGTGQAQSPQWAPLAGAAIWALFPINVLPTLFVVQRMETMAHSFVFAGLWMYVHARRREAAAGIGIAPVFTSLLLFTPLAILCKESGALLPLYAALAEALLFGFRDSRGNWHRSLIVFFGLFLVIPGAVGGTWQLLHALQPGSYATRDFTLGQRLLTEPRVLVDYLQWTILPVIGRMGLFHDDYRISTGILEPASTLAAIIALAGLAFAGYRLRRRRPLTALGIAWFFAGHAMTATFISLELVFEHRNYFPSLGIALVMLDLLMIAPLAPTLRRAGWLTAILSILCYAGLSHVRALEWNHPLRFALSEAAKQPNSPRATYQLGQTLSILSHGNPDSPYTQMAFDALERARHVPNGNILPAQGLLLLASRLHRPLKDEWWDEIIERLRTRPVGAQERSAIMALSNCAVANDCAFPPDRMVAMFVTALTRYYQADTLNAYADYVLNRLGNARLAEGLLRESIRVSPREPQYRANLVTVLLQEGKLDEADAEIARLRAMRPSSKSAALADELARNLRKLRQAR